MSEIEQKHVFIDETKNSTFSDDSNFFNPKNVVNMDISIQDFYHKKIQLLKSSIEHCIKGFLYDKDRLYLNNIYLKLDQDIYIKKFEKIAINNIKEFIQCFIFIIKKYYSGLNRLKHKKSNSGKKRSVLLLCIDYFFDIHGIKINDIKNTLTLYSYKELHQLQYRYGIKHIKGHEFMTTTSFLSMFDINDYEAN
jgi:hypothetical protein